MTEEKQLLTCVEGHGRRIYMRDVQDGLKTKGAEGDVLSAGQSAESTRSDRRVENTQRK